MTVSDISEISEFRPFEFGVGHFTATGVCDGKDGKAGDNAGSPPDPPAPPHPHHPPLLQATRNTLSSLFQPSHPHHLLSSPPLPRHTLLSCRCSSCCRKGLCCCPSTRHILPLLLLLLDHNILQTHTLTIISNNNNNNNVSPADVFSPPASCATQRWDAPSAAGAEEYQPPLLLRPVGGRRRALSEAAAVRVELCPPPQSVLRAPERALCGRDGSWRVASG